ncbi:putative uncharacterized protein [Waddlia chondrophila 2032/99]|nr:putative uncharacterized protein [Waddlia chondrophila 2032/99]
MHLVAEIDHLRDFHFILLSVYIFFKTNVFLLKGVIYTEIMFELLMIVACIGMNAFLAAYETAFIASSKPLVRRIAADKTKTDYLKLLFLKDNPERTLSVIQVGITFVGMFAAAVGGVGVEKGLSPYFRETLGLRSELAELLSLLAAAVPLTYFTVVFGELIPKTFALRNPLRTASRFSHAISKMSKVFWPVVLLLEKSTKALLKWIPRLHESEQKDLDDVSEEFETMSAQSKEYVLNLFKIEKTKVASVFIPWNEVDILEKDQPIQEVEEKIIRFGHTRLPVFESGRCVGVLNAKEFLALLKAGKSDWSSIIHPSVILYEQAPLLSAFRIMQKRKAHMGIVKDLHGVHLGIVTMEDIFEEIVGDIYDEDDDGSILKILMGRGLPF